jgi:DNA polymerase-3 subunit epsilon
VNVNPVPADDAKSSLLEVYASEADLERMAALLADTGRYQVLRRLERCPCYNEPDDAPKKWALYVDVETTGLDPDRDAIIEFAGVLFEYCPASGRIYRVEEAQVFHEDPRCPIPAKVTRLTGIRDEDVAGKRLDEEAIHSQIQSASLIVAHNAYFDRRFLERRLPAFRDAHWACSLAEIPWDEEGLYRTRLFGQVAALNQAAFRVSCLRTSAGVL